MEGGGVPKSHVKSLLKKVDKNVAVIMESWSVEFCFVEKIEVKSHNRIYDLKILKDNQRAIKIFSTHQQLSFKLFSCYILIKEKKP